MEKQPYAEPGPPPSYSQQQQPPYPPQQHQQYPPQQHQQPYQQQPQVITQVVVTAPVSFQRDPVACQCPHCHSNITTSTHESIGIVPWLICGGLILLGCWLGCCVIPFCIRDLKDVEHRCPNCNQVVGKHKLL